MRPMSLAGGFAGATGLDTNGFCGQAEQISTRHPNVIDSRSATNVLGIYVHQMALIARRVNLQRRQLCWLRPAAWRRLRMRFSTGKGL